VFSESLGACLPDPYDIASNIHSSVHRAQPQAATQCYRALLGAPNSLLSLLPFVLVPSVTLLVNEVRRMVGCSVDDELERMWKERFVGKFVSLSPFP
jgi:hypothetical protein